MTPGAEPVSVRVGGPDGPGVLCVHGFGGSPGSLRPIVEAFVAAGFSVEAPLLPGHGTSVADLAAFGWDDWLATTNAAFDALAGGGAPVVVLGQSMGGSLALALALARARARATGAPGVEPAGLVCVNGPVRPQDQEMVEMVREMVVAGELTVPAGRTDVADPSAVDVAYDELSLPAWLSFMEGLAGLEADAGGLAAVRVPTLVVTGALDRTVDPGDGELIARSVAGPVERLVLPGTAHVAALDVDRGLLAERAVAFARTWAGAPPR